MCLYSSLMPGVAFCLAIDNSSLTYMAWPTALASNTSLSLSLIFWDSLRESAVLSLAVRQTLGTKRTPVLPELTLLWSKRQNWQRQEIAIRFLFHSSTSSWLASSGGLRRHRRHQTVGRGKNAQKDCTPFPSGPNQCEECTSLSRSHIRA